MGTERAAPAWRCVLVLIVCGSIQALCFAPGPLPDWILPFAQIATLAALAFYVFSADSARQAAWRGLVFGIAQFAVGVYWLTISMHEYGGLALPLAIAALLLFSVAMALYPALACAACRALCPPRDVAAGTVVHYIMGAALWASCWTLAEWLRGTLFTGFPWLNIGYAHAEGMFAAWAPFVGVYGLAWLAAFASGAIALMARAKDTGNDARAATAVGLAIVTGLLGIGWTHIAWVSAHGEPILLRLVQTNTPQSMKFDPARFEHALDDAMLLASLPPKAEDGIPQLIILPETVIPLFQDRIQETVWQQWRAISAHMNASILMGVPLHRVDGGTDRYTNSAIALDAHSRPSDLMHGQPAWHYDKHHLVPFGEFVPPGFRWFVDAMHIPLGDFDRGAVRQPPLHVATQNLAVDICYENAFGEEIIQAVRPGPGNEAGASILVNLSNLAWFGDSWALRQHLQIARMRALETARPVVTATNTGMTAAINSQGQIMATLNPAVRGVLDVEIQGTEGLTPYVRWGNLPILSFVALCLLGGLWRRRPIS